MRQLALTLYCVWLLQAQSGTTNSWPFPPLPHPAARSAYLIESNRIDEALQDLKWRIESDKENGGLWGNLTIAFLKQGENALAVESCRKAVRHGDSDKLPLLVLLLIQSGHVDEARCLVPLLEQLSAEASAALSSRIESLVLLTSYSIAKGDEKWALERIGEIEAIHGWEKVMLPVALSWLALQAEIQGHSRAKDRLISLTARLPRAVGDQAKHVNSIVNTLISEGFTKTSLISLQDHDCGPTFSLQFGGEMRQELELAAKGKIKEAAEAAEALVVRRPGYARAWRFLGTCYSALGNPTRSFQCTSNAIVLGDAVAVVNLAKIAGNLNDTDLLKSLCPHLEYMLSDSRFNYSLHRIEAFAIRVKLADVLEDRAALIRLFSLLPIAVEDDEMPMAKLGRLDEILQFVAKVSSRHSVEIDESLVKRCRAQAAIAASRALGAK